MRKTLDLLKVGFQKLETKFQLHKHQIKQFKPHVYFSFERGNYIVQTAQNGDDLESCLKLRFDVFNKEFKNENKEVGIDVDDLDFTCDHLMIISKKDENKVVGTYRLNCSKFNKTFYSSGEFKLGALLEGDDIKLELGRACIAKDHRNGVVITLLWRAIAEYLQATESKMLFGCTSVKTIDVRQAISIYKYLQLNNFLDLSYGIHPTLKYKFQDWDSIYNSVPEPTDAEISELVPPLFKSYLKMNARVLSEPALDLDFNCIDYLVVLKMSDLNPLFTKKYKV